MSEPVCVLALSGWELLWICLEVTGGGERELAVRRERLSTELRAHWSPADLGEDATVAALRRLFKAAGTVSADAADACLDGILAEAPVARRR